VIDRLICTLQKFLLEPLVPQDTQLFTPRPHMGRLLLGNKWKLRTLSHPLVDLFTLGVMSSKVSQCLTVHRGLLLALPLEPPPLTLVILHIQRENPPICQLPQFQAIHANSLHQKLFRVR